MADEKFHLRNLNIFRNFVADYAESGDITNIINLYLRLLADFLKIELSLLTIIRKIMKNLKQLSISFAILTATLFSSCLGDHENDYTTTDKLTGYFNVIFDKEGNQTYKGGVAYEVKWWYNTDQKADLTITGLQLPDGQKYSSVAFSDVSWKLNARGWQDISFTNATPSNIPAGLKFDNFNFQLLNRIYGNLQFPACSMIEYTVNDSEYRIISLPQQTVEVGDTRVSDPSGKVFTTNETNSPFYYFILNPDDQSAFVVIQGAKFAEQMPAMNMKFPGMKFNVDVYGNIIIHADELTPTLMSEGTTDINAPGTPFEAAKITNFVADYRPGSGVDMTFSCTIATKDQPVPVRYDVTFTVRFPSTAK